MRTTLKNLFEPEAIAALDPNIDIVTAANISIAMSLRRIADALHGTSSAQFTVSEALTQLAQRN